MLNHKAVARSPLRLRGDAKETRDAEIERRYRAGETMQEIGDALGITRERVRQVLEKRGVPSRPARCPLGPRRQTRRKIAAHRQAIVELKRQGFTINEIARRFRLSLTFVSQVLCEALSEEERRMLQRGGTSNQTPEAQLLEQIREAYRVLGPTMRARDYDAYMKTRGWTGGFQTLIIRFGSWHRACELAGVSLQMHRYRRKRRDFINRETCLAAVRYVRDEIGKIPTRREYERYARTTTMLPSRATVHKRCGGWKNVIRVLLMDAGPQEASGK